MSGKHILLGVTGGVAAYKAAQLVRLLTKLGDQVDVVMTEEAAQFVTSVTFQALSGHPVYTDLWDQRLSNAMTHIVLSRTVDAFLIAPATANTLFKLAHGVCDDLLSTLAAARTCPLIVAPAMNQQMWNNPPTQRNIAQLMVDGITVWGPDSGAQACGEEGAGRMLEPEVLVSLLEGFFREKYLVGKKILLTAGPTYEAIDAVRGITNVSSGKMGYAMAQACYAAGAEVTLISGPTQLLMPPQVRCVSVLSAQDMYQAVMDQVGQIDVFISVAAVADYRVKNMQVHKIKKGVQMPVLELEENPDILATVAQLPNAPFCVGFAAESENLLDYAEAKRRRKNLPLLVANLVQDGVGKDDNLAILLDKNGAHALPKMSKPALAWAIVQHLAQLLRPLKTD